MFDVRELRSRSGQGSAAQAPQRPALLLDAEAETTQFVGRDRELMLLRRWYDSSDRVSVMLVHGSILRLVRAAATHPHLAELQLYPLVKYCPRAVLMAQNNALIELTEIRPEPPGDVLNALQEAAGGCKPEDLANRQEAIDALRRLASRHRT
jgi:hypothetical protein